MAMDTERMIAAEEARAHGMATDQWLAWQAQREADRERADQRIAARREKHRAVARRSARRTRRTTAARAPRVRDVTPSWRPVFAVGSDGSAEVTRWIGPTSTRGKKFSHDHLVTQWHRYAPITRDGVPVFIRKSDGHWEQSTRDRVRTLPPVSETAGAQVQVAEMIVTDAHGRTDGGPLPEKHIGKVDATFGDFLACHGWDQGNDAYWDYYREWAEKADALDE